MTALLTCPFCGGSAAHYFNRVQCERCFAGTAVIDDQGKREMVWNTRHYRSSDESRATRHSGMSPFTDLEVRIAVIINQVYQPTVYPDKANIHRVMPMARDIIERVGADLETETITKLRAEIAELKSQRTNDQWRLEHRRTYDQMSKSPDERPDVPKGPR